jgi:subtilisin family serine protease
MRRILLTLLPLLGIFTSFAQTKYWIFFKDKDLSAQPAISEKCKSNRKQLGIQTVQFSDLPVNENYVSTIQNLDIQSIYQSKWLNAISARLTDTDIQNLKKLSFVQNIVPLDRDLIISKIVQKQDDKELRVDNAMKQIGVEGFINSQLTGKGITVGVIDAGFYGTTDAPALSHLTEKKQILGIRDYINPQKVNHYTVQESYSDFHGTEVLNAITGKDNKENVLFGAAPDATFYLARTDSGNREFRGEEDNWIAAMEWMDSLGVRLINTSLGYAKGFSNPKENYRPDQMDGKTSVISKAAKIAIEEKGMTIVVSAGNEGDDREWRIVSTPADVDGIIAVGATNDISMKMGYSSIGPEFLTYTKPDVSCYSLFGTSLAAPVITGFVACLMQAKPSITNKEIKRILEQSASLYPFTNNYIGFGVPNATKALSLLNGNEISRNTRTIEVEAIDKSVEIAVIPSEEVVVFNKKDATHVLSQESYKPKQHLIQLRRNPQTKQMTVLKKDEVVEVIWK